MKPQGALGKMTSRLARLGRCGDRADLDGWMDSAEAATLKGFIPTRSIPAVAAAYDKALAAIERRHKPIPKGKPRAKWTEAMVLQLAAAWMRHGGNVYRIARDLGITEEAARRAYRRFIVPGCHTPSQPQERLALAA